jgi:hypothetical protein
MNAPNPWNHGTVIVLQEVWHGHLWTARPVRVVEDRSNLIALWCPAGTPIKGPSAPWRAGRSAGSEFFSAMLTHLDWLFADFSWPTSNLMLLRPGIGTRSWSPGRVPENVWGGTSTSSVHSARPSEEYRPWT